MNSGVCCKLQLRGFGGAGAAGFDGAGAFGAQAAPFDFCILPSSFFLPRTFHPQPVEQRALGLLLAGGQFD
jgi:hypothetical protein